MTSDQLSIAMAREQVRTGEPFDRIASYCGFQYSHTRDESAGIIQGAVEERRRISGDHAKRSSNRPTPVVPWSSRAGPKPAYMDCLYRWGRILEKQGHKDHLVFVRIPNHVIVDFSGAVGPRLGGFCIVTPDDGFEGDLKAVEQLLKADDGLPRLVDYLWSIDDHCAASLLSYQKYATHPRRNIDVYADLAENMYWRLFIPDVWSGCLPIHVPTEAELIARVAAGWPGVVPTCDQCDRMIGCLAVAKEDPHGPLLEWVLSWECVYGCKPNPIAWPFGDHDYPGMGHLLERYGFRVDYADR